MQANSQDRFYNEILNMSRKNSSAINTLFSKERIEILIRSVKQAKDATKSAGKDRTHLKQVKTGVNLQQWSEGLRFIQFQKNRSYHRVTGQSPYKALFGFDPKVGLSSSSVPRDLLPGIQTEEDLEAIFESISVTTDNTDSDNVIIPVPSVDRGPTDERNIKGVVVNVNEHDGYKIGTKDGQIKGYFSRNQVQFIANATLDVSEVPMSNMSLREIVRKISLSGRQDFVHCQCKKGNFKSGVNVVG
ncbi:unnamed protein product [Mytilus coruscus]|uniref:Uncharacterized protein n=1 Tax=Mytilus coruscus TaxID=42192 RepID=A0A6J8EP70_MYTCO|nr:unnamed protein product [Mytilus coruscus]